MVTELDKIHEIKGSQGLEENVINPYIEYQCMDIEKYERMNSLPHGDMSYGVSYIGDFYESNEETKKALGQILSEVFPNVLKSKNDPSLFNWIELSTINTLNIQFDSLIDKICSFTTDRNDDSLVQGERGARSLYDQMFNFMIYFSGRLDSEQKERLFKTGKKRLDYASSGTEIMQAASLLYGCMPDEIPNSYLQTIEKAIEVSYQTIGKAAYAFSLRNRAFSLNPEVNHFSRKVTKIPFDPDNNKSIELVSNFTITYTIGKDTFKKEF